MTKENLKEYLAIKEELKQISYKLKELEERKTSIKSKIIINSLNKYRDKYLETKEKQYWWQMIQLLPSSYNQKRTVQLNYEVLNHMYHSRKNHKLDEWKNFCKLLKNMPYSEFITGEFDE